MAKKRSTYSSQSNIPRKKAWVVDVAMGYGHQRAAYPLKDIAYERILTANSDKVNTKHEKKMWNNTQWMYEWLSKMNAIPLIGKLLFGIYYKLSNISPFYPFRDLSKPTLSVFYMCHLMKKGLGKSVIEYCKKKNIPFITTFYLPALFADHHGIKDVYLVVTDTDINRAWVPREPKRTKIKFLAPTHHTAQRLLEYGVPEKNIFAVGFPLPKENLGGESLKILKKDLGRRLPNLDPQRIFLNQYRAHIKRHIGKQNYKTKPSRPLTLTYNVGGAGAQSEIGIQIINSLRKKIANGEVIVNLVAGTHLDITEFFHQKIKDIGMHDEIGKGIKIIYSLDKHEYFALFNELLRETDILWTKPSELSFYTALGLPLILTPPIGAQEVFNRKWLLDIGSAFMQGDPRYTHEWLFDHIEAGRVAEAAWEGFMETPKLGTYNIEHLIFEKKYHMDPVLQAALHKVKK